MASRRSWSGALVSLSLLLGCSDDGRVSGGVGTVTQALSPCNEMVPATRFIDGLPAYAQCDSTQNSAIYSNNGVDTATSAMGSDWVRTQSSGGYQCTELAHRYLLFKWNVTWLPRGNAGQWCDTMPTAGSGVVQTMSPVHGDIMVLAPGSCGADATTGHVAVVDTVAAKLSAVQQNIAARSSYAQSCAKCFLHVVANDGTTGASGTGGAAGTANGGAAGAAGASFGSGGSPPSGAGGGPGAAGTPSIPGNGPGGSPSTLPTGGATAVAGAPPISSGGYPATPTGSGSGGVVSAATAAAGFAGVSTGSAGQAGAAGDLTGAESDSQASCSVGRVGDSRRSARAAWLALALVFSCKRRRATRTPTRRAPAGTRPGPSRR